MQRILILLVFILTHAAYGQVNSRFYVDGDRSEERVFPDSSSFLDYTRNVQKEWLNKGYIFAGIDSVIYQSGYTIVYLHKGRMFRSEVRGLKKKGLAKAIMKKVDEYTYHGYPFASVRLDSFRLQARRLSGSLKVNSGPQVTYDSAIFITPLKTNPSYIYHLLDVVPGDLYSEKDYRLISKKIMRSSFLDLRRPADLSFRDEKATVYLDLVGTESSSFQGVLGLQQGQQGKTIAVGSVDLDLQNLFRSGKQLAFSWERFSEASQRLQLFYKHPFFLGSKLTPSFRLDLLKQDTVFLTRQVGLGIHTYVAPRLELFFEYEQTVGSLLTSDFEVVASQGLADFSRNVYQVQVSRGIKNSLDQLQEGLVWSASLAAGRKEVNENLSLPDIYYDTIQAKTNFFRMEIEASYQVKVFKRQAFFHSIDGGFIKNDELLRNELYRIGGLSTLRGFNEKTFFTQEYVASRLEFRSFFEKKSYAYVFYDQLVYHRDQFSDYPLGLGLGFALATSSGQFSFAMAVGKSSSQDISFSTMKIHFGYISRF